MIRRAFAILACCGVPCGLVHTPLLAEEPTGIYFPGLAGCDARVEEFMERFEVPGMSMAITKNGKLVYLRGFGSADLSSTEPTQPHHMFRVASVSKPITAIAIMKLVEQQRIGLEDRVFGPGGLLEAHPDLSAVEYGDPRIEGIVVRHLLEHSAGWDRSVDCFPDPTSPYGFQFGGCDPHEAPLHVAQVTGTANPASTEAMIDFLLQKGVVHAPGSSFAYSNIGFAVLGEIIETVTHQTYEDYVKDAILAPLGICDMHLTRNLLADKHEREVEYHGIGPSRWSVYGTGEPAAWEYGGVNLEAMDAYGAWIASARDLTRLIVAVDRLPTKPDILSWGTINTMTTPSPTNVWYAKGWQVNTYDHWWHDGTMPGTFAHIVRTSTGYTWAILLNRLPLEEGFYDHVANLPWNCIAEAQYPYHDLMLVPARNASDLQFSAIESDSVTVSWTNGDGDFRLVVASEGVPVSGFPLDGVSYSGNAVFGKGAVLANGNPVVHSGASDSVVVTGLSPGVEYHFRVFEYNQRLETGNHALYMLCGDEPASVVTTPSIERPRGARQWRRSRRR